MSQQRTTSEQQRGATHSMPASSLLQRPTALVIDDEHAVRWVVRKALEPEVCDVIEAADGISGIRRVSRGTPPVDVVIVDLKLANLNGLEVIESLSPHPSGTADALHHRIWRHGDGPPRKDAQRLPCPRAAEALQQHAAGGGCPGPARAGDSAHETDGGLIEDVLHRASIASRRATG